MWFILGCIVFLFFQYYKCSSNTTLSSKNNTFTIVGIIVLTLIVFLKAPTFGSDDLDNYYRYYNELSLISYQSLFAEFTAVHPRLKEPFFYIVAKPFADIGIPVQIWVGAIGFLFAYSTMTFTKKYSANSFMSCMILFSLGFLTFSMTGLRQSVALSIVILSYNYIQKRKFIPFLLTLFLASLFHTSSIFFVIAYFVPQRVFKFKTAASIICGSCVISVFFPSVFRKLIMLLGGSTYEAYSESTTALSWSGFIIQVSILAICIFLMQRKLTDSDDNFFLNLMVIALAFQAFRTVVAEAFRIAIYFSIFEIAVIPNAVYSIRNPRIRKQYQFTIEAVLLLYMLYSRAYAGYRFFWT